MINVSVRKASRESRLGIRLVDSTDGVEIVDVHPDGPMATYLEVGDVILSVNGLECTEGKKAASKAMQEAESVIELKVSRGRREGKIVGDVIM